MVDRLQFAPRRGESALSKASEIRARRTFRSPTGELRIHLLTVAKFICWEFVVQLIHSLGFPPIFGIGELSESALHVKFPCA